MIAGQLQQSLQLQHVSQQQAVMHKQLQKLQHALIVCRAHQKRHLIVQSSRDYVTQAAMMTPCLAQFSQQQQESNLRHCQQTLNHTSLSQTMRHLQHRLQQQQQ